MSTTVPAADPAHFLSLVPHLLGFTPADSLVVVPFAATRSLGVLRVDLPDVAPGTATRDQLDAFASTVVGMVCRIPDADGLIGVVYTSDPVGAGLPGVPVLAALHRAADACGIRTVDHLTVGGDGWGSHFDDELPATGRPLTDIAAAERPCGDAAHPATPLAGDQRSGAELPRSTAAERRAVAGALRSLDAAVAIMSGMPRVPRGRKGADAPVEPATLTAACELDDPPALFERVLDEDPSGLAPLRAALLVWCLSRPSIRDVALVQWATDVAGGDAALDAQRRWEDGADYPEELGRIMWGDGDRPVPARLQAALELVRHVAAVAPRRMRPGPLALCGWLSWSLRRSTHAESYARRALEIDPDHGLAEIMLSFVQVGHLPDWAFRPSRPVR